jgi:hypothetical protein
MLIKEYEVIDRRHLKVFELLQIKKLKSINIVKPCGYLLKRQQKKQHCDKSNSKSNIMNKMRRKIKYYQEKYREKNRVKLSEKLKNNKIACGCRKDALIKHEKTKKQRTYESK